MDRPYYRGDFELSLQFFSFNRMLNNWLADRPDGISTLELIDWAARGGYDAVEIAAYYIPGYDAQALPSDRAGVSAYAAQIRARARERGLAIGGTGLKNDFTASEHAVRERDVERTKYWIEIAAELGTPLLRLFSGFVPPGYENRWNETAKWMADCFARVAEYAKPFGVKIGVQNHGDSLATAEQTIALVKMVDDANFGAIDDTGFFRPQNATSGANYDWYADIEALLPYSFSVWVKSKPGGREDTVPMDLPRLFHLVRASAYRGLLAIEHLPRGDAAEPDHPMTQMPQFLAQVREALELTKRP